MHRFSLLLFSIQNHFQSVSRLAAAGVLPKVYNPWNFRPNTPHKKTTTVTTTVTTTRTTTATAATTKTTQSTEVPHFTSTTTHTSLPANTFPADVRSISTSSSSSPVPSTEKSHLSIQNTVFISLISSLALLSMSIIVAYCILTYLNRYLNKQKNSDGTSLLLNRGSLMTSMGSYSDASLLASPIHRVTTPNNNLPKANIGPTLPRRSSTESVELFRF